MTAYEHICRRLAEVTGYHPAWEGGDWVCPTDDDHTPSLSVSQGDNKTLLHCQAGCATNAVMEKLGLPMEALYDDYYDRDSGKTGPLAIYGYPDASGHVRYRVVRMPGHRFYQQRPDGKGGWVNKGVPPEQRVLYHLPEVLGAVQAGDPVFVTEGEKDADALVRDGYVATCNPGGAGKWLEQYCEELSGAKTVVVVTDRDQIGYRHARTVARSLRGRVGEVFVAEPLEGKDVSDHLVAGRSIDELTWLGDEALDAYCAEPGEPQPDDHHGGLEDEATSWEEVDLTATLEGLLSGAVTRPAMTLGQRADGAALFYPRKVNNVFGESGKAAKTFVLYYIALQEIRAGHHVVWVDFEDDEVTALTRLVLDFGASPEAVLTYFHYHRPEKPFRVGRDCFGPQLEGFRPSVVFIDSGGESIAIDGYKPNDDESVATWVREFPRWVARRGAGVIWVDHPPKYSNESPAGSHRKRAAVDGASYWVEGGKGFKQGRTGRFKLTCSKDRHGHFAVGELAAVFVLDATTRPYGALLEAPADGYDGDEDQLGYREPPAQARVRAALRARAGEWVDRVAIGNMVAEDGKGPPLKATTITDALADLVAAGSMGGEVVEAHPENKPRVPGQWRLLLTVGGESAQSADEGLPSGLAVS